MTRRHGGFSKIDQPKRFTRRNGGFHVFKKIVDTSPTRPRVDAEFVRVQMGACSSSSNQPPTWWHNPMRKG